MRIALQALAGLRSQLVKRLGASFFDTRSLRRPKRQTREPNAICVGRREKFNSAKFFKKRCGRARNQEIAAGCRQAHIYRAVRARISRRLEFKILIITLDLCRISRKISPSALSASRAYCRSCFSAKGTLHSQRCARCSTPRLLRLRLV